MNIACAQMVNMRVRKYAQSTGTEGAKASTSPRLRSPYRQKKRRKIRMPTKVLVRLYSSPAVSVDIVALPLTIARRFPCLAATPTTLEKKAMYQTPSM